MTRIGGVDDECKMAAGARRDIMLPGDGNGDRMHWECMLISFSSTDVELNDMHVFRL